MPDLKVSAMTPVASLNDDDILPLVRPALPLDNSSCTPVELRQYVNSSFKVLSDYGDVTGSDITAVLQAAIDDAAGVSPLVINNKGSSYKLTGRVTAPSNTTIILNNGAELEWTATTATGTSFISVATRPGIEVIGHHFKLIGDGVLRGPSVNTYVANESAIVMIGSGTGSRKLGLHVEGIEILDWGSYGILPHFVDNCDFIKNNIHDVGFCGILPASCRSGSIQRNRIHSIKPGVGGEALGISLSSDTRNYSSDINASINGRLVAHPFCQGFDVSFNEIYDIPLWNGLDAHGAYETKFHHNNIYNCRRGLLLGASSGDATNYAGEGNSACFNNITSRKRDGSATTVTGGLIDGIICNGGSAVLNRGIRIVGNDIEGCGDPTTVSRSITAQYIAEAVISKNTIRNWAGEAIYIAANADGILSENVFGALTDATLSRCISLDSVTTGSLTLVGNRHTPQAGTVAGEGVRISGSNDPIVMGDNDFDAAVTPFINVSGETVKGLPETVTATNVITADESGKTFYLNSAGGFTSELPLQRHGLKFKFVVKTAPTTAYVITTNSGENILFGTSLDVVGELVYFSAQDTINFVAGVSVVGDALEVESDGTNWYCKAISGANGGITSSAT